MLALRGTRGGADFHLIAGPSSRPLPRSLHLCHSHLCSVSLFLLVCKRIDSNLKGSRRSLRLSPCSKRCGSCNKPVATANGVAAQVIAKSQKLFQISQTNPLPFPNPLGSLLIENATVKTKILPRRREMINNES